MFPEKRFAAATQKNSRTFKNQKLLEKTNKTKKNIDSRLFRKLGILHQDSLTIVFFVFIGLFGFLKFFLVF